MCECLCFFMYHAYVYSHIHIIFICIYIYIIAYVFVYVFVHVFVYVCMHACLYTCVCSLSMHVYLYICMCTHTRLCMCAISIYPYICIYIYVCLHIHIHIHIHICACVYLYACIWMYIYICTYFHTSTCRTIPCGLHCFRCCFFLAVWRADIFCVSGYMLWNTSRAWNNTHIVAPNIPVDQSLQAPCATEVLPWYWDGVPCCAYIYWDRESLCAARQLEGPIYTHQTYAYIYIHTHHLAPVTLQASINLLSLNGTFDESLYLSSW